MLGAGDSDTQAEFGHAIDPAVKAFVRAARSSGDDRLSDLGRTYARNLNIYLTDKTLDAREAGNNADLALDRAAERCTELGFTGEFPQEPTPGR